MEKWVNFTFKNRKGKLHFTMMDCCVKEEERQYMVGGGGGGWNVTLAGSSLKHKESCVKEEETLKINVTKRKCCKICLKQTSEKQTFILQLIFLTGFVLESFL